MEAVRRILHCRNNLNSVNVVGDVEERAHEHPDDEKDDENYHHPPHEAIYDVDDLTHGHRLALFL